MRHFFSYGPVNAKHHFCVSRTNVIERCTTSLIGQPEDGGQEAEDGGQEAEDGGHYFTIWAPRQAGKTWLMRQVTQRIRAEYGDRFQIGNLSMQGVIMEDDAPAEAFLEQIPFLLMEGFNITDAATPKTWNDFRSLLLKDSSIGLFEKPLILFIDEFDSLPRNVIDRLVTLFRDMYLKRDAYLLHGLALIGVRAVLGVDSQRGSPFNIQRSLHVPNFTQAEVQDLFQQYQDESGQTVLPEVIDAIYAATNGQPGLIGWFGELLTEKYNPAPDQPLTIKQWERTYLAARTTEPSNNLLNLIAKARNPEYQPFLAKLFSTSDIPFALHHPLHNYLYLNGIISPAAAPESADAMVCRFSSPFVQRCLYDALSYELLEDGPMVLVLNPLDMLEDVFAEDELNIPALLHRYVDYLARLKAKGLNPWKEQPRRETDFHLTEAVGHFHLYAWLRDAIGDQCVVSPEFPTGNGKVDLHIRWENTGAIIEVKSFTKPATLRKDQDQAARYAKQLGYATVTLATFVPVDDDDVLAKLSGQSDIDGVRVNTVAIGWT